MKKMLRNLVKLSWPLIPSMLILDFLDMAGETPAAITLAITVCGAVLMVNVFVVSHRNGWLDNKGDANENH